MENEIHLFGDINNMCRLCSKAGFVNIFDKRLQDEDNLAEIVEVTTGVRISPTDEISQMLCKRCMSITIMMFKFRTTSMLNDLELKEKASKQEAIDKSERENYPANITKLNISPRVYLRRCDASLTQRNDATVLRKKRKSSEKCNDPGKKFAETRVESTLVTSIHKNKKGEIPMSTAQHLAEDITLGAPAIKKLKLNEKLPNQKEQDKQKMNELKLKSNEKIENQKKQDKQKVNELKRQDGIKLQRDVEQLKQKEIEETREERDKREEEERKKIGMEGRQEEITPDETKMLRKNDKSLYMVQKKYKQTFVCEICARVYYSIKKLKKHQIIHRRCSLCKVAIDDRTTMKEHEKACTIRNIMNNLPTINIRRCEEIEEFRKKYNLFEYLNVIEISDDEEDISSENFNKNVVRTIENNTDNTKKNTETIQQSPVADTTNREKNASSETPGPSNPKQLEKQINSMTSQEDNNLNPAGEQLKTTTVVESRIPSSDNLEQKKDKEKKNSSKSNRGVNKKIQINSDETETISATTDKSSSSNLKPKNEKFPIKKISKKPKKKAPRAEEVSPQRLGEISPENVQKRTKNNRDIVKKRRNCDTPVTNEKGDGNSTNAKKRKSVDNKINRTNEASSTEIKTVINRNAKSTERDSQQDGSNKSSAKAENTPETIVHSQNQIITVSNKSSSMEPVESNKTKNTSTSRSSSIREITDQILHKLMQMDKPKQPLKMVEISPRNQSVGLGTFSKPPKVNENKYITRNLEIPPKLTYEGPYKTTNTKQVEKIKNQENQVFPPFTTVTNCSNTNATDISGVSTQAQTFVGNTINLLDPTIPNSNSATASSNMYGNFIRNGNGSNFPMMAYPMNNPQPVQNFNVQPTLEFLYSLQLEPNNSLPVTASNIVKSTAPVVMPNLVNAQLPVLNSTLTMSNQIPVVYSGQYQQN